MVLGSMGMKRIVVQVVNRFGYRHVLVASTLALALVSLLFMGVALAGWYWLLPVVMLFQGMVNSVRFSTMNTLTLRDLPDAMASSGNSLLSMVMQLSMSVGVSIAGLLLGAFGHNQLAADSSDAHGVFFWTYLCMALIIAVPALVFARVPDDVSKNAVIARRKRSAS
jgi:DHA2 family multidrug resistance protein-like MFS transporter